MDYEQTYRRIFCYGGQDELITEALCSSTSYCDVFYEGIVVALLERFSRIYTRAAVNAMCSEIFSEMTCRTNADDSEDEIQMN